MATIADEDGSAGNNPALASRLIGHDDAFAEFQAAFAAHRAHHAWLLQGPSGIGKATAAFFMARSLLERDGGDPDALARQIAIGAFPNLIHVERQLSDRGTLKTQVTVDEIRQLKRVFQTTSGAAGWRIAIIDPIDDLNRNAANALLKILEEPPERSLFLLVNHSPGRILPTIRSRCRVLRFSALGSSEVLKVLTLLDLPGAAKDIAAAADRANGSVRNAIMLLEGGGLELETRLDGLLHGREPEWSEIQSLADAVSQRGSDMAFDLVIASLGRRMAEDSERALAAGHPRLAGDLAQLWMDETERLREALLYNLDRRQMLLTHFAKRFSLRSQAASH